MAFAIRSLATFASVPVGSNRSCIFYKYATNDAVATVIAAGYFNDAREKLKVNDVIEAVCAHNSTGDRVVMRVTAVPASGDVTVAIDAAAAAA